MLIMTVYPQITLISFVPLWLWSYTFLVCHKHGHELVQPFRILIVEPADCLTIQIEHAEQSFTIKQRHDDFRIRSYITRDASRKLMHVRHADRLALFRRDTAHACAHRNSHTRGISLKWTKHELF